RAHPRLGRRLRRGTLDRRRSVPPRRSGPRDHRGALRTLHVEADRQRSHEGDRGVAREVRRTPDQERRVTETPRADAFILFGATGDLAKKSLYPALHELEKRGRLGIPVVGMARSEWSVD